MKKIINGKTYSTDTAKAVGEYTNGIGSRDFSRFDECLYRKKTGEYFLYGEGGPMTRYAVASGSNSWSGGSRIMPMSYDEAKDWAEKHLTPEEFEAEFGEVDEGPDDGKRVVSIYVNATKWDAAKREAARRGIGISEYIESLI